MEEILRQWPQWATNVNLSFWATAKNLLVSIRQNMERSPGCGLGMTHPRWQPTQHDREMALHFMANNVAVRFSHRNRRSGGESNAWPRQPAEGDPDSAGTGPLSDARDLEGTPPSGRSTVAPTCPDEIHIVQKLPLEMVDYSGEGSVRDRSRLSFHHHYATFQFTLASARSVRSGDVLWLCLD